MKTRLCFQSIRERPIFISYILYILYKKELEKKIQVLIIFPSIVFLLTVGESLNLKRGNELKGRKADEREN